jgi:hypothetical protein
LKPKVFNHIPVMESLSDGPKSINFMRKVIFRSKFELIPFNQFLTDYHQTLLVNQTHFGPSNTNFSDRFNYFSISYRNGYFRSAKLTFSFKT